MKIKVPREIKVAGHWWNIRYEEGLARKHSKYGLVDTNNLMVLIEPSVHDSLKSQTLIHELEHIVSDQFVGANAFTEDVVGELATGTWIMLSDLGIEFDWSEIREKR